MAYPKSKNSKNHKTDNKKAIEKPRVASRITPLVLTSLTLLLFLALLTYNPQDVTYLQGGIEGPYSWGNSIGFFGAVASRALLLLFGLAIYPVIILCLLSLSRRLISRSQVRPVGWEYWISFLLILFGAAMLCGIWPDLMPELTSHLDLTSIPGGVIGQYLCGPEGGKIRIVLAQTGTALVAATLCIVGLMVLWVYDWHDSFLKWRHKIEERKQHAAQLQEEDRQPGKNKKKKPQPDLEAQSRILRSHKRAEAAREKEKDKELTTEAAAKKKEKRTPKPPPSQSKRNEQDRKEGKATYSSPPRSGKKTPGLNNKTYELPSIELLESADENSEVTVTKEEMENKKIVLQATLDSFNIQAKVGKATSGSRVTLFEVEPAPGVKVERISNLSNNIAMELQAQSLRILAPIPGRKSVGIEVPNDQSATVSLASLMDTPVWRNKKVAIPLLLGRNISGRPVLLDLAKAPHLLIAGATGSGKSVCINALIISLLYRFTPEELRLILIDPKVVEFSGYSSLPHLAVPIITDPKKVPLALRWVINEMEKRYNIFAAAGARNISAFNARPKKKTGQTDKNGNEIPEKMPYIIIVIDELADIMMTAKSDVENSLARIAQLSRAVGIHTIIATQRPSVNVITGIIKANYPTRIAFQVTSQVDSRTILDGKGAEKLLGRGDMLFKPPGASQVERNQSPMVEDHEIDQVVEFVSSQAEQNFEPDVFKTAGGEGESDVGEGLSDGDEQLIEKAIEIILQDRRATTSYVQRCLRIGYNRAAMIMEILEQRGVIGPQIGSAPREILITREDDEETDPDDESPDREESYVGSEEEHLNPESEDDNDYEDDYER